MPDPVARYALAPATWLAAGGVAVAAFVARVAVIAAVPVMPEGDGYTRLGRVGELVVHASSRSTASGT